MGFVQHQVPLNHTSEICLFLQGPSTSHPTLVSGGKKCNAMSNSISLTTTSGHQIPTCLGLALASIMPSYSPAYMLTSVLLPHKQWGGVFNF